MEPDQDIVPSNEGKSGTCENFELKGLNNGKPQCNGDAEHSDVYAPRANEKIAVEDVPDGDSVTERNSIVENGLQPRDNIEKDNLRNIENKGENKAWLQDTTTENDVQLQKSSVENSTEMKDKMGEIVNLRVQGHEQVIRIEITPTELDSGIDTENGTSSPDTPDLLANDSKQSGPNRFHVHPVYEKNPKVHKPFRKISGLSAYSEADSDQSPYGSSVVPSRKGSTVLIDEHPEVIYAPSNYLSVISDMREEYTGFQSPRMSIFSCYSQASRSSCQSDRTFHDTHEALPHPDHYRDVMGAFEAFKQRPTMYQLREEEEIKKKLSVIGDDLEDSPDVEEGKTVSQSSASTQKLGWIQGVLVRCLLNIFGVMLFLRLTWITGQAGIGLASVIILLSAFVTTITTMSMSAICTNGEVKGGGAYYMISRSLGPEFGGAIGIVFSLANAVAAAMYIVGFAETVRDLMWENGAEITGNSLNEVRIIGCITAVLLLGVVLIGLDFESKAQLVLLLILVAAIVNVFIGSFLPPSDEQKWNGFIGYSVEVFTKNFGPDFRGQNGFFKTFSIFFPAATGILAGANISGDLKNPSVAIPKGTFLAILLTTFIYLGMVWTSGSCLLRDALGVPDTAAINTTEYSLPQNPSFEMIAQCGNATCQFGMQNDNSAIGLVSAFRPLILAGIFSATLSSALASIVSAPKVFQALGKDELFPFIKYFAKGFGKTGEPRRGYILTFGICIAMTCVGALDIIAPIISNFFLMAYALINFSCFDASFANSPGFRPGFKLYNKWASLMGALLCLAVMFLINWWAALVTFVVTFSLYLYIRHRKPDVNWGSSNQAHAYRDALKTTLKLVDTDEHVKNFRPQILVLSGYPRNRPALIDFVSSITKRQSLLMCGHVFQGDMYRHLKHLRSTAAYAWFRNRNVRAFYNSVTAISLRHGAQILMQTLGVGKLRPNTVIFGYKSNWQQDDPRNVFNYFGIIHDAFDLHYGVGILRLNDGFDLQKVSDDLLDSTDDTVDVSDDDASSDEEEREDRSDNENIEEETEPPTLTFYQNPNQETAKGSDDGVVLQKFTVTENGAENPAFEEEPDSEDNAQKRKLKEQLLKLTKTVSVDDEKRGNCFRQKQEGTIDVWWLFDDGGLTLLIPYILSTRKQWKSCKLRVFCAGTKRGNIDEDQRRMATLLSKFRIDYSQITVISDLRRKPRRASYKEFESMIYQWRLRHGESRRDYPWKVSDADLLAQKQKTYMKLKLREKLLEHSKTASLIVLTLPVPRTMSCPAGLYMTWLEMLTRGLPPTFLLRGNQQSVLTYFS